MDSEVMHLANRFMSDTATLPDEWQDWRAEFAGDLRKAARPSAAGDAVVVDDAMVDRAVIAFMQSATKGAWTYQARMEAALTAALTGAQP